MHFLRDANQPTSTKMISPSQWWQGKHWQTLQLMWGTANCSAILEEPGYEVIKDLKTMLCEDEYRNYRFVAASLLQNLCAHCRVKLMSHPDASEHLSSALTIVSLLIATSFLVYAS